MENPFRFKLRTLLFVVFLLRLPFVLWPLFINWMLSFDTGMQRNYEKVAVGAQAGSAFELLGEPFESTDQFSRALNSYRSNFPAAELQKCTEFHCWQNGANWFYCIGIDCRGNIVLKAEGHS